MVIYKCDLCGEKKECFQKEIDHREYDVCRECWSELQAKLQGKGRATQREIILLPPPKDPDEPEEKPAPVGPPIIRGNSERLN